jgi:hypothetical protein
MTSERARLGIVFVPSKGTEMSSSGGNRGNVWVLVGPAAHSMCAEGKVSVSSRGSH